MTERTKQLARLQTVDHFIAELRLFSQDNKAEFIEQVNGTYVIEVDPETKFYADVSSHTDEDTGETRPVLLLSKVTYKEGEMLENSREGLMIFMETGKFNFPIITIEKDHPFLDAFFEDVSSPDKKDY